MENQITIIDFYKNVSQILEQYRTEKLSYTKALADLMQLNALAHESGLEVSVPLSYLKNIHIFDDEMSYNEVDDAVGLMRAVRRFHMKVHMMIDNFKK